MCSMSTSILWICGVLFVNNLHDIKYIQLMTNVFGASICSCCIFVQMTYFKPLLVDWCYQSQVSCNDTCTGKPQDKLTLAV